MIGRNHRDSKSGSRHPLPESGEARHDQIPETYEREKGRGEDDRKVVQPASPPNSNEPDKDGDGPIAVNPDGEPYPVSRSRR